MILLLFGAPGTGKSTYAKFLAKEFNLEVVSLGEILRQLALHDKILLKSLSTGELIANEFVDKIMFERLTQGKGSFILDGYPRTVDQARNLIKFLKIRDLKIDHVFHLDVPEPLVVARTSARGRDDDHPTVLKRRFEVFERQTKPILEFFKQAAVPISEIDNSTQIGEVEKELLDSFKN